MSWLLDLLVQLVPDLFGFAVAKDAKEQEAASCGCLALILCGVGSVLLFFALAR